MQNHDETEQKLIEKLRKIEALYARATSPGEKAAAESARERIQERIKQLEKSEPVSEYQFSLPDRWSRSLFLALLRRYGIKPYRYHRQRHSTVMVRITRTFADEVLWPEFQELSATLHEHLEAVTQRIITEAIHSDLAEAEEQPGQQPKAPLGLHRAS